jgi:SAM-dependent methyltransferase
MTTEQGPLREVWAAGQAYESYVGRWSRPVAAAFLQWLAVPHGKQWLDVGCGTGALTQAILASSEPASVTGIDPSAGFIAHARARIADPKARFAAGNAQALPIDAGSVDAVVSGLVLNFVQPPALGVAEMVRVARPRATVGAYVWDYAGKMELMRHFWDAAVALDPAAASLDEGDRFPICRPGALAALFRDGGLEGVDVQAIDVATHFRDFDDYWTPFLGGQGPAPGYVVSLAEPRRAELRERLRSRLPVQGDGSIRLVARAWAVRGTHC